MSKRVRGQARAALTSPSPPSDNASGIVADPEINESDLDAEEPTTDGELDGGEDDESEGDEGGGDEGDGDEGGGAPPTDPEINESDLDAEAKQGAVAPMRIRFEHCVTLATTKFQRHHTSHGEVMLAKDLAPNTLDEVLSKGWAVAVEEDADGE